MRKRKKKRKKKKKKEEENVKTHFDAVIDKLFEITL